MATFELPLGKIFFMRQGINLMWILDEQDDIWQKEKIPFKISFGKN